MTENAKVKIENVRVKGIFDVSADTSYIGKYTNSPSPGAICRQCGKYLEDAERGEKAVEVIVERLYDLENVKLIEALEHALKRFSKHDCRDRREYNYFLPYAGGEKWPSAEYKKYGKQDFERIDGLERGEWAFYGIMAEARVEVLQNKNTVSKSWRIHNFTSGGLWGIESDSGDEYLNEIKDGELNDLKEQLEIFGVDTSNWQELTGDLEIEYE